MRREGEKVRDKECRGLDWIAANVGSAWTQCSSISSPSFTNGRILTCGWPSAGVAISVPCRCPATNASTTSGSTRYFDESRTIPPIVAAPILLTRGSSVAAIAGCQRRIPLYALSRPRYERRRICAVENLIGGLEDCRRELIVPRAALRAGSRHAGHVREVVEERLSGEHFGIFGYGGNRRRSPRTARQAWTLGPLDSARTRWRRPGCGEYWETASCQPPTVPTDLCPNAAGKGAAM